MVALAVCCNKKLVPVLVHGREEVEARCALCWCFSRNNDEKEIVENLWNGMLKLTNTDDFLRH